MNIINSSDLLDVCGLWRHLAHHCGRRRWRRLCQETKVHYFKYKKLFIVCFMVLNFDND